jgi:hypothetical protein
MSKDFPGKARQGRERTAGLSIPLKMTKKFEMTNMNIPAQAKLGRATRLAKHKKASLARGLF